MNIFRRSVVRKRFGLDFNLLSDGLVAITDGNKTWILPLIQMLAESRLVLTRVESDSAKAKVIYRLTMLIPSRDGKSLPHSGDFDSLRQAQKARGTILKYLATLGIGNDKNHHSSRKPSRLWRVFKGVLIASIFFIAGFIAGGISLDVTPTSSPVRALHTSRIQATGWLDTPSHNALKEAARSVGIPLTAEEGKDGETVYVISGGPDCDACKDVDRLVGQLPMAFSPVIIPAAQEDSQALFSLLGHVYCNDAPGRAWLSFSVGLPLPSDPATCDWQRMNRVLQIMVLPAATGLTEDGVEAPVIIAPNGAYHAGSLGVEDPVAALEEWLTVNSLKRK